MPTGHERFTMPTVTIPSELGVRASLHSISEKFWANEATVEERATRQAALVGLAATYNEIMRAERAHRKTYKCEPNWNCRCPVHAKLSSDCAEMYRYIEYLDYKATDGHKALTQEWWEARGFKLVVPGDDPVFDYVLLDGKIPVTQGILERAARWWVEYMERNLAGRARLKTGTFAMFEATEYDPIDWTDDLRQRLQSALVGLLAATFAKGDAPSSLEPMLVDAGPWGHSSIFSDACSQVGFEHIGIPNFPHNVSMKISPASIAIEETLSTPESVI
jgi:hypothetical protein